MSSPADVEVYAQWRSRPATSNRHRDSSWLATPQSQTKVSDVRRSAAYRSQSPPARSACFMAVTKATPSAAARIRMLGGAILWDANL